MSFVDTEILKRETSLSDVVSSHGIELRNSGGELVGLCPFHDERTPSFYVNDQKGVYHCFGCQASGDVFDFLQAFHAFDFQSAISLLGGQEIELARRNEPSKPPKENKNEESANRIWACSGPIFDTPAERYLARRGLPISHLPDTKWLRFTHTWHRSFNKELPALIAAFTDDTDVVHGIQRIFLSPDGCRIEHPEAKLSLGSVRGNAIRLGGSKSKLVVCEGLEDGLSIWAELSDHAVWIAGGTSNLCQLPIPNFVRDLTIAADNDEAGRSAALRAAESYLRPDRSVRISPPPVGFKDYNEMRQANV